MTVEVFRFGDYRLDPAKRELEHRGELIVLTPHVFDCLTYLVSHRDRAIGRDELIAAVWGRADVSDTLLAQTVMHARRAVGDSGGDQHAIRTIPRFGYRWVDEATDIVAETPPPAPDLRPAVVPVPMSAQSAGRKPPVTLVVAMLLMVIVAAAVGLNWRNGAERDDRRQAPPATGVEPLLVLPVAVAQTPESTWIPLGLMDSIAGRLRQGGWAVVPSATVVAMAARDDANSEALIVELTAMTGAGLLIRPQARRVGDEWQVRLQLSGADSVPADITGNAADLLDAARLASDRLAALLLREPLPEAPISDPDAALVEQVQRIEAELLANRLDAAAAVLSALPRTWQDNPEIRYQRAFLDYRTGSLAEAESGFVALIDELATHSDERALQLRARALIGLGSVARTRTRFDQAIPLYQQAIDLLAAVNQPSLIGMALTYQGISRATMGDFESATAALARARVVLDGTGDAIGVVIVDAGFATMQADRRRLADAVARLSDAIERFDRLGAESEAFDKRIALTQMSRELLDVPTALTNSAVVWERARTDHSQRLFPMAAAMRAMALLDAGQLRAARDVLTALEALPSERADGGYQWRQARAALARLLAAEGVDDQAESVLAALVGAVPVGGVESANLWRQWFGVLRRLGRGDEVAAWVAEVDGWPELDSIERRILFHLIRGEQDWAMDERVSARRHYEQALAQADELGVPAQIAMVAQSFGSALIDAGLASEAAAVVGRLAAWSRHDYDSALLETRLFHALGQAGSWRRALERLRALSGERVIPAQLTTIPTPPAES